MPRQIWTPDPPPGAAQVPLIIGGTDSELSIVASNSVFELDERGLSARLDKFLGTHAKRVLAVYRHGYPNATPGQLLIFIATGVWTTKRTVRLADLKAAQHGAPLFVYQWMWRSQLDGGRYLSPHGVDLPFVWDNLDRAGYHVGGGRDAQALAERVSARWLAFARAGAPNDSRFVRWQPYAPERRSTLVIDQTDRALDDPHADIRLALAEVPDAAVPGVFGALRA